MSFHDRETIDGYSQARLIEILQKTQWMPCAGGGFNFTGIVFDGACLIDAPDVFSPIKYTITVVTIPPGKASFLVEGYQSIGFMWFIRANKNFCVIAGNPLQDLPFDKLTSDQVAYRVTVLAQS